MSEENKISGFVKVWRAIQDNEIFLQKPFDDAHAWIDLLLSASWKARTDSFGRSQKPGDVHTSQQYLSKRWGWGRNRTRVLGFLNRLRSAGMISYVTDRNKRTGGTFISVTNWAEYQGEGFPSDLGEISKNGASNGASIFIEETPHNGASSGATSRASTVHQRCTNNIGKQDKQGEENKQTPGVAGVSFDFVKIWKERHQKTHHKPPANTAKARAILKRVALALTEEQYTQALRAFYDDQTDHILQSYHNVRFFEDRIDRYVGRTSTVTMFPQNSSPAFFREGSSRYSEDALRKAGKLDEKPSNGGYRSPEQADDFARLQARTVSFRKPEPPAETQK